jgi:hypothetical protein
MLRSCMSYLYDVRLHVVLADPTPANLIWFAGHVASLCISWHVYTDRREGAHHTADGFAHS